MSLIGFITACQFASATACSSDRATATQPVKSSTLASLVIPHAFSQYHIGGYVWENSADSSVLVVELRTSSGTDAIDRYSRAMGSIAIPRTQLDRSARRWVLDVGALPADSRRAFKGSLQGDSMIAFVAHAYRDRDGELILPANRISIRFRSGVGMAQIDSLANAFALGIVRRPDQNRAIYDYEFCFPSGVRDPFAFADSIGRSELVAYAEPDRSSNLKLHSVPTDPFYSLQSYLKSSTIVGYVPVDIAVERVWDFTKGYRPLGVNIAVLDDGIQGWHSDFSSTQVAAGFDAIGDCAGCARDPQAPGIGFSHGTAVAGIIGASQNNGAGIAGIAPDAVLIPVRIYDNLGNTPNVSVLRDAINWSWNLGQAAVINASWDCCGGGSPSVDSAIASAVTLGRGGLGTVVVFSAGNFSYALRQNGVPAGVKYPASSANAISVSALQPSGDIALYAPRGKVDIVAPSSSAVGTCAGGLTSLDRMGAPGCNDGPSSSSDYTSSFGGTSAAAPQVAAVAALLLAREPSLTVAQVRARLTAGADPWGRSDDFGAGKLNATFTVLPFSTSVTGPSSISSAGTYNWTAAPIGGDGNYSYSWAYQNWGQSNWIGVSGGANVSRTITASTPRFRWRLTVFSVNRQTQAFYDVTVNLDGCSPFCE